MRSKPLSDRLVPRDVIESIILKKVMHQFPGALLYKSMIKFKHGGGKTQFDLELLPVDVAGKISALFD